jgi:hypothetical protein
MKRRLFLITVVLAVLLTATCAFAADIAAAMANGAALANNTVITAVTTPTPRVDTGIVATNIAITGANINANSAGLEANQNTANTGPNDRQVAGTALVNSNTLDNAGAMIDANIAGANKEVEQNNSAKNAAAFIGNAAGAGAG